MQLTLRFFTTGILLIAGALCALPAGGQEPPTDAQLRRWIADLGHDRFVRREEAQRRLSRAGSEAIGPLAKAAVGRDLEVTVRAVAVLGEMALSDDRETAQAAREALEELASPQVNAAADQAADALQVVRAREQDRAIAKLFQWGAHYGTGTFTGSRPIPSHLVIERNWHGGDRGLEALRWMRQVTLLSLHGAPVTDAALPHLARLRQLTRLELYGTQLSDRAIEKIRETLPAVEVDVRRGGMLGVSGSITAPQCLFNTVRSGSAADRAGLRAGDVVVMCEGQKIDSFPALTAIIATKDGGDKLKLVVERNGQRLPFEVTLGRWGE